ncbi:MAG: LysR family transcriptional regulator [Blastocatellia bacterium]|nr:LysR family transcriptional regulator [Blastocatellia bacterium]
MAKLDLNLLVTLEAVLAEGNVTRAARRLGLSPSAMSRALARLRKTTGDPLLVRAGRGLVPTPRAIQLRDRVSEIVQEAEAALGPADSFDPIRLDRTFTIRTSDGFVENFGPLLIERARSEAPKVKLRFVQKQDRDSSGLRDGTIDLETGVVGDDIGPEVRTKTMFRDRFVGVVRSGHPLSKGKVTLTRYLKCRHISVSRRGILQGPVDDPLASLGEKREIAVAVSGFATAIALARMTDLVATVPERHTANLRSGMRNFPLPFPSPELSISLLWHPRMEADPAHRWLRAIIRGTCSQ